MYFFLMLNSKKIKVLVTDDSLLFRSFLSNALQQDPDIEVVGTAMHGKAALSTIPILKPDVMTLDIEMPEMNGLETLTEIKKKFPLIQVIMVSSHTSEGADITLQAMEMGAADFALKENSDTVPLMNQSKQLQSILIKKIKRAYQNVLFTNQIQAVESLVHEKQHIIESAQNLIIPGSIPLCIPIACEEHYLGHLLLLIKNLKKQIHIPLIFKIMVSDVFLASLVKSFQRNNPAYTYIIPGENTCLEKNHIYLLGMHHSIQLYNMKGALKANISIDKTHITKLNALFQSLEYSKLPNTPVFLLGDDQKGDGISGLKALTYNGTPTVFITKTPKMFAQMENELANKILDINIMTSFINKLF